ncbi:hypothetical protein NLX67_22155 [Domibacillus sp. A3M-37]|uniref:hypothetical protein n=1 Tax=Domibacillus TaxID=1433999 RepID=UPI000618350B|nr:MULTISPECIES: hypothetical protein [Domibacillus]MCP3765015.1 hypothetical protein [Domibacillus sp. A3M-37]
MLKFIVVYTVNEKIEISQFESDSLHNAQIIAGEHFKELSAFHKEEYNIISIDQLENIPVI